MPQVNHLRRAVICLALLAALFTLVPPAFATEYVVQPGDTLTKIAQRFGVSVQAILDANRLQNANQIFVGQHLTIADGTLAASAPAPVVTASPKGLAMATRYPEDLTALGVSWYYVWGWCDAPSCVPMVRSMELPPTCPATLLVGNEPNAVEPFGAPMTPAAAAARVRDIENACPNTLLVVGNVSYDDWSAGGGWGGGANWVRQFQQEYRAQAGKPFSQAIGVHCYSQHTASYCTQGLAKLRGLYAGKMWVTEFGILDGDETQFSRLLNYVASTFDRYAAYTNRQPHTGKGWEIATGVELVNGDGTLTPAGQVYAQK